MGKWQHYVPAFITAAWANPAAASLLPPEQGAALSAASAFRAARTGGTRTAPTVVIDKRRNNRIIPSTPERIAAAKNLYSLPALSPVDRGIALQLLFTALGRAVSRPANDGDLLAWAQRLAEQTVGDSFVEDEIATRIDTPTARIVRRLRRDPRLIPEDVPVLSRFLTLAMVRAPVWRNENAAGLSATATASMADFGTIRVHPRHAAVGQEFLERYLRVSQRIGFLWFVASFLAPDRWHLFAREPFRLNLLDARQSPVGFATCDNPARQLELLKAHRVHRDPLPGFKLPTTALVYPISPGLALCVSTRPDWMPLRTLRITDEYVRRLNTAFLNLAVEQVVLPGVSADCFTTSPDFSRLSPWRNPGPPQFRVP